MSTSSTITATALLGAMVGVSVTAGLILMIAGLVGTTDRVTPWRRRRTQGPAGRTRSRARSHRLERLRWPAAPVVGLLVWLVSRWPVAGLIAAAIVVGAPALLGTERRVRRELQRLEALQAWTRRLADLRTAGGGLEQTLTASLKTCPEPIRPDVANLVARLHAGRRVDAALRAFADDLAEPAADLVVAVLLLDAERRSGGVARVLDDLADTVAEEVAMRRKVEADRAKPRTSARIVTAITLGAGGIGAFNTTYVQPYGSPLGQLVLAAIAAGIGVCLWWIRRVAVGGPEPRLLRTAAHDQPHGPGEPSTRAEVASR